VGQPHGLLFAHLPTPAQAGQMAAKLFAAQTWMALACGLVLMMTARAAGPQARMDWGRGALGFVAAGLLVALLAEFAIAPRIVARQNLALWHTLGSAFYAVQWVCAATVLWKLAGVRSSDPS
jgi:hypothetical protein